MESTITLPFSFFSYTIEDLVKYIYGDNAKIDYAIPNEERLDICKLAEDHNAHHFYVMDYSKNTIFGKLVNLKEEFFNKVAREAIK